MGVGGSHHLRRWAIWSLPRHGLVYVLALDLAAVIVTATCLTFYPVRPLDLVGLGWIALCAGVGIELSQRVERLRERHRDTPYNSLNGVWTLAAALLFPPGVAVLVPVVIYVWSWFR